MRILGIGSARVGADVARVRVRYASGGIAVVALIALPASATAGQGGQVSSLAAQQCAQQRATIGKKAFHKKYGAKKTMRTCVKRARPQVAAAVGTAAADCQDELAQIGSVDFIDEYGDDPTDSLDNSMDECVGEGVDTILNPDDEGDDTTDDLSVP